MSDLDERTVIDTGGWDGRYAVVRAVGTLGDQAAAVVDANGDGADINLEFFCRTGDNWELCVSSGGAGDWGRGSHEDLWAEHDRDEHGWRLTLTPRAGEVDDSSVPASGGYGWYAYTPHRR
ncbi:hypothetical protein [Nocardioides lianchengensis]|uniref:Uncharacterized protein n=1 Tax=Nocardioides lianchengensis TaxID=1045774 RepID=A0A1G6SNS8_9ACTN|nr:hypothetical protein [Nocardioides lianchengensis]NYG09906.1 hypothetical protein [Nocardioides lianchengensis]SDD18301.1 hypothetical protein SAMN05421872_106215 [Nocardioides lianchengensis]